MAVLAGWHTFLKYSRYLPVVNQARYLISRIPANLSDIMLGALALGTAELLHSQLPISIGLIVIGVILLVRSATIVRNG
jgi:hypothetical protein